MGREKRYKMIDGMKRLPCRTKIALSVIAAVAPSISFAEENVGKLEKIEVTAQKRSQSVNEIGMSISALNDTALEALGVNDTADLAAVVPGLTVSDTGRGIPTYTLRGIGFNGDSYLATSTVSIYVDEAAIPYPVMTLGAFLDVERVEVLKGPQGTLYGRNTTGGAINYIAAKPEDTFSSSISTSYSSFETFDLDGYVTGALSESVNARLAFRTIQSQEGWQENIFNDETLGEQDKTSFRLSLDSQITSSLYGLIQLGYARNKSDTQAPQFVRSDLNNPLNTEVAGLISPLHAIAGSNNHDTRNAGWTLGKDFSYDTETHNVALRLEYNINNNMDLVSVSSYSRFEDNGTRLETEGYSGVRFEDIPAPFTTFISNPLEVGAFLAVGDVPSALGIAQFEQNVTLAEGEYVSPSSVQNFSDIEFFSQELRLVGSFDSVNWVAGIYYSSDTIDDQVNVDSDIATNTNNLGLPFVNFTNFKNIAELDSSTAAIFLHTEWQLSNDLNLTVGGRYSDDKIEYAGCSADTDGSIFATFVLGGLLIGDGFDENGCATLLTDENGLPLRYGKTQDELDENSFSWRVGLDWDLDKNTLLYASVSNGFKAGAFNNTSANIDLQQKPVVQEELLAYELGVKSSLLEGAMQLNASLFNYDYSDKQVLSAIDTAFGTLRRLDNAADATVVGADVEVQWLPDIDGLFISSSLSWVDSEIDNFIGTDLLATGTDIDFSGSRFIYTPELQYKLQFNYEWEVGEYYAFVGGDMAYSSDTQADYTPAEGTLDSDLEIDSFALFGARVGIADQYDTWNLSLWVRNLTDELYVTNVVKPGDSIVRFTGRPRTIGVTFTYNFE